MDKFLREFATDFIAIAVDPTKLELGVRVGNPIFKHLFEKIPEYKISDTKYNRQNLKWFKYEGIDVGRREIKFYSRLRIMKFEKKPWPFRGTYTTYDNAWDISSGLNLEVHNRSIKGNIKIRDTNSDWPSGLGGIIISVIDAFSGSANWILTGNFNTLSDIVSDIIGVILNITDAGNISSFLKEVDGLNKRGLLYLKRTDYESKGLWMWYTIDPNRTVEALQKIENEIKKRGWIR